MKRNQWIHFALTWHPRRGVKLYIDSNLKKTNRYWRNINQREDRLNKLHIANNNNNNRKSSSHQLFSLVLEEKQWDQKDVEQAMIYFWNGKVYLYILLGLYILLKDLLVAQ